MNYGNIALSTFPVLNIKRIHGASLSLLTAVLSHNDEVKWPDIVKLNGVFHLELPREAGNCQNVSKC